MNETLYRDPKTGDEKYLPDGLGEKLGYERADAKVPAELQPQTSPQLLSGVDNQTVEGQQEKVAVANIDAAIALIEERFRAGDLTEQENDNLDSLARRILFEQGSSALDDEADGPADDVADTTGTEEPEQPGKAGAPARKPRTAKPKSDVTDESQA